jgi:hypothetical protein
MRPNHKEVMWDAEQLAKFANAEGEKEIKTFRREYQGVFPSAFWDDLDKVSKSVWKEVLHIPDFNKNVGPLEAPRCWAFQQGLRRAWEEGFPPYWAVILIAVSRPMPDLQAWPYQLAVMFLAMESWRARFCGVCGSYFVADKPARRFCSIECSAKGRRASRNAWWHKEGNQRRKVAQEAIYREKSRKQK